MVKVTVSDINDNNPKFDRDVYVFDVPENSPNHVVGTLSASDADDIDSNTLRYRLEYDSR
mgnify:CR=1 FL=1